MGLQARCQPDGTGWRPVLRMIRAAPSSNICAALATRCLRRAVLLLHGGSRGHQRSDARLHGPRTKARRSDCPGRNSRRRKTVTMCQNYVRKHGKPLTSLNYPFRIPTLSSHLRASGRQRRAAARTNGRIMHRPRHLEIHGYRSDHRSEIADVVRQAETSIADRQRPSRS